MRAVVVAVVATAVVELIGTSTRRTLRLRNGRFHDASYATT